MEKDVVHAAYDPEAFRRQGHALVELLANHLASVQQGNGPVLKYQAADKELEDWETFLAHGDPDLVFKRILERTTQVHHPKYMGHQVAPPLPQAALAGLVGAILNNGMAVYEMGMAPSAMERLLTDWLCRKAGYGTEARGFLTSGGTLANLTALLAARRARAMEDVWNKGLGNRQAVLVSEAAHYCIDRAARIMGMGAAGVIRIPVDSQYRMDPQFLEAAYQKALADGLEPIALVGSAPCTATGSYDPLEALADFCAPRNLWLHIDGAHGGAAMLSEKYAGLMKGVDRADSLVMDGHKMMGMPILTTALLFRNGADSYATFSQEAAYLLGDTEDEDWYNLAKRTFECTKLTGVFSWYTALQRYGEAYFSTYLDRQYDLAREAAAYISGRKGWELACLPESNILCFRYCPEGLDHARCDQINETLRQQLLTEGRFYIVQTRLGGRHYLRTSLMNPFTGMADIEELLAHAEALADTILRKGS